MGKVIQRTSHINVSVEKSALEFSAAGVFDCSPRMKISSDDQKAIGLILLYLGLLFFLIGLAGRLKSEFQFRAEISCVGFTAAAIAGALGVVVLLFSLSKKQG